MIAAERKKLIVDQVNKHKIVKVVELSKKFNTTEATIRRDLEELQQQKKVRRVHGGAIAVTPSAKLNDKDTLKIRCIEEKKRIALAAYEFIDEDDALTLDASTTVFELAKLIVSGRKKNISIITNSFDMVALLLPHLTLRPDIMIFHTGGVLTPIMNAGLGSIAVSTLENMRTDKCFLGVNGIDPDYGYSCPSFEDAAAKKAMLKSAKQRFILSDHTKISEMYMGKFADFTGDIDYLIVDKLPEGTDEEVYSKNVNLVIAERYQ